ncbi:MAG: hypothetical protein KGQ26_03495 [Rhodospirillales bacterium]|nr:hypothetical protein [Rhodospirillales bacterium]
MDNNMNAVGYFLLSWLDYRGISVFSLGITVIVLIVRGLWQHKMPELLDALALFFSIAFVFSGLTIFCVFDLTNPPAFQALDGSTDGVLGVVVLLASVFSLFFGIKQLRKS